MKRKTQVIVALVLSAVAVRLLPGKRLRGTPHGPEPKGGASAFAIDWYSIDGGGGTSTAGEFALTGIIGQTDAATSSGGAFSVSGGLFSHLVQQAIFSSGFETGDLSEWN